MMTKVKTVKGEAVVTTTEEQEAATVTGDSAVTGY